MGLGEGATSDHLSPRSGQTAFGAANWKDHASEAFPRETGINVRMTRTSSGETCAQIKAEESQPRGDFWWGDTGDPHLQAAQAGLTEEYKSPMLAELQDWSVRQVANPNSSGTSYTMLATMLQLLGEDEAFA